MQAHKGQHLWYYCRATVFWLAILALPLLQIIAACTPSGIAATSSADHAANTEFALFAHRKGEPASIRFVLVRRHIPDALPRPAATEKPVEGVRWGVAFGGFYYDYRVFPETTTGPEGTILRALGIPAYAPPLFAAAAVGVRLLLRKRRAAAATPSTPCPT